MAVGPVNDRPRSLASSLGRLLPSAPLITCRARSGLLVAIRRAEGREPRGTRLKPRGRVCELEVMMAAALREPGLTSESAYRISREHQATENGPAHRGEGRRTLSRLGCRSFGGGLPFASSPGKPARTSLALQMTMTNRAQGREELRVRAIAAGSSRQPTVGHCRLLQAWGCGDQRSRGHGAVDWRGKIPKGAPTGRKMFPGGRARRNGLF